MLRAFRRVDYLHDPGVLIQRFNEVFEASLHGPSSAYSTILIYFVVSRAKVKESQSVAEFTS